MPFSTWEDEVTVITNGTQTDSPPFIEAVVRRPILRRVVPLLLAVILIIAAGVIPPFIILFARTTTTTTTATTPTTTTKLPVGTIILFGGDISTLNGSTDEWLLCDGSPVSRTTYQDLFEVIGVMYGSGNGIDTFNLPDFSDRFPLGSSARSGGSLVAGGASSHTITVAELPAHTHDQGTLVTDVSGNHNHSYSDPGHNHGGSTGYAQFGSGDDGLVSRNGNGDEGEGHSHSISPDFTGITIESDGDHTHIVEGSTGSEGSGQAIDMMPPYQTTNYIILA